MPEFPTWNSKLDHRLKRIFPVGAIFIPEFQVVVNLLKSEISNCFERGSTNVECLSFKEWKRGP
jgi:hypothetical protein